MIAQLQRRVGRFPIELPAAAALAIAIAFLTVALPDWRFERAVAATGLFLVARVGFLTVLDRLWDSFTLIYGPLTIAALLLLWTWVVSLIVLFGGSLASHINAMLIEGSSAREAELRHVARKPGA